MKSLPIFLAVLAFLLWARAARTPWLFFGWGFLVTGVPLLRGLIGPIPVYLFDVAVVLVWTVVATRPGPGAWPHRAPPWVGLFLAVLAVFGTLLPTLTYGFHPEMVWNLGHTGLAMTTLVLGAFLLRGATAAERDGLRRGLAAGLLVLTAIALLQKSSPEWNATFIGLFYGDGDGESAESYTVLVATTLSTQGRVSGPFGSPNTFGIVALIAAVNHWLLLAVDRRRSSLGPLVLAALLVIAFASGSRQVVIAGAMIAIGWAVSTSPLRTLPRLAFGAALVALVMLTIDADAFLDRLLRLSEGADEANVAARLSEGPQRFWEMLAWDPGLIFTGVGLEIQKLARYNVDLPAEILEGFVSNGFLLYLYYFGVFGFLVMTAFWIWVLVCGFGAAKALRPITAGAAVALVFVVFSDNHAVLAEELVNQIMILVGLTVASALGPMPAGAARPTVRGGYADARRAAH